MHADLGFIIFLSLITLWGGFCTMIERKTEKLSTIMFGAITTILLAALIRTIVIYCLNH